MKSINVLEIIAEELEMPYDSSLSDILVALFHIDTDGEIMNLLVKAGTDDLLERFKTEGVITR